MPDVGTGGLGRLSIDNGTAQDAAVALVDFDSEEAVRYVYIAAHRKYTMRDIEVGKYRLRFELGGNWVDDDFTCSPSFSEFEKALQFVEPSREDEQYYKVVSVTLHPVLEGNARTTSISRTQFRRSLKLSKLTPPLTDTSTR
jgi:hypothetical protein